MYGGKIEERTRHIVEKAQRGGPGRTESATVVLKLKEGQRIPKLPLKRESINRQPQRNEQRRDKRKPLEQVLTCGDGGIVHSRWTAEEHGMLARKFANEYD